jgi:hypothetical protein
MELYRLAKAAATLEELLAYTQPLIIVQCLLLFPCDNTQNKNEKSDIHVNFTTDSITGLARYIWQNVPAYVPRMLSSWRASLPAGSIRRTIIIAHILWST